MTSSSSRQRSRLLTFSTTNSNQTVTSIALSNAGFVKRDAGEDHDVIECPWCHLKLKNLHSSHSPLAWHRVYSKYCPFLNDNECVNAKDLGISFVQFPMSDVASSTRVLRSLAQSGNDPIHEEGNEIDSMSSMGSQSNGNITISPDASINADGMTPTTAEELNQLYREKNQPRQVLPKSHIDAIRKPLAQIESLLSTFTYERHRRLTFNNWPKKDIVSPRPTASGFVYLHETEDTVECIFCKVHIGNWTADMIPDVVHMKKSKHCPLMKGSKDATNIPDHLPDVFEDDPTGLPSIRSELGIITESTKHPDFAVESRRKATFLTWPSANHKLVSEMIEHALFYAGHGDVVCCFSCGIEMSGWTSTDNIWSRHARQAPHCQLVVQEKGADWVAATIEEHGPYVPPQQEPTVKDQRDAMETAAVHRILRMTNPPCGKMEIQDAVKERIKFGRPDWSGAADVMKAVVVQRDIKRRLKAVQGAEATELEPPVVVSPSRQPGDEIPTDEHDAADDAPDFGGTSNNDLEQKLGFNKTEAVQDVTAEITCKICIQEPVGMIFLPCGHLVCCQSCGRGMEQCPLCRQDVLGYINKD